MDGVGSLLGGLGSSIGGLFGSFGRAIAGLVDGAVTAVLDTGPVVVAAGAALVLLAVFVAWRAVR